MKWKIVFADGKETEVHNKETLMVYLNTYSDEELENVDRIERVKIGRVNDVD